MEPVVITGIGAVTPIGNNASDFARSLKAGKVGVNGTAFRIKNYSPPRYGRTLDPHIQYILSAAEEAVCDSALNFGALDRSRIGVAVSSSKGGMRTLDDWFEHSPKNPSVLSSVRAYANFVPHMAAQWVARHWKTSGPIKAAIAACATGLYALMEGVRMIEEGDADICISGAGDSSMTELMLSGYRNMGVLSSDGIRPFDLERDGFMVGEGAGIVILEKLSHAKSRRVRIYGTVLAHQYGFEASHPISFSADGTGLKRCLTELLRRSDLSPADIDYLNLHGTATRQGDLYETRQIKAAFGKAAYRIPMSATKSLVGHMLGASGAVEAIACLIALRDGFIPPTANLEIPDPECDLDYTPRASKPKHINIACSLSMGFGGQLGAILVAR